MTIKGLFISTTLLISLVSTQICHAHEDMAVFHAFRLEADAGENRDHAVVANWALDGWLGGDEHKLWLKSEGEMIKHTTERSEYWAMYSYNLDTFWDVQTGIRYDDNPVSTTYFVTGFTGLAPYHFETQVHLFISSDGDISVRIREENNVLLTQQLILQPYLEVNAAAQAVPAQHIGTGLNAAKAGLQFRYEITRKFAPYLEFSANRSYGDTADRVEAVGSQRMESAVSAGLRWLF